MIIKFYPVIRLFPQVCVFSRPICIFYPEEYQNKYMYLKKYRKHVQTVLSLTLHMHYKENHRIIDTSNFKYKICMFIYIIMTCGNWIQDFHNIEVIEVLKNPWIFFPFPFLNCVFFP